MANKIELYPTNIAADDLENVRNALRDVSDGGTIVLKRHRQNDPPNIITPFNFGGDVADNSIALTKSVKIQGDPVSDTDREWTDPQGWAAGVKAGSGTTIEGGRIPFNVPDVANMVPPAVVIEDIRFSGFYRCAIRIYAALGHSRIKGCSFVNYNKGYDGQPKGAWPVIADATGDPSRLAGKFELTNNYCGTPPATRMNNLIHISNCQLDLEIKHNRIEDMYWLGFAVYGNSGHTAIIQNNITKKSTYDNAFLKIGQGAAISFGLHVGAQYAEDGTFTISENTIDVGDSNSDGIVVFRSKELATGQPSIIQGNIITMSAGAVGAGRAAVAFLGASWSKAECAENTISGPIGAAVSGSAFGILVSCQQPPFVEPKATVPSADTLKISGNNLKDFVAARSQVFVDPDVKGLELKDNSFGTVSVEPPNAYDPWSNASGLPSATSKAVIWWQGYDGKISDNAFDQQIPGWVQPPHIGCVYLDNPAHDNRIEYDAGEPPFQYDPAMDYDKNQIYDATASNIIVPAVPA